VKIAEIRCQRDQVLPVKLLVSERNFDARFVFHAFLI